MHDRHGGGALQEAFTVGLGRGEGRREAEPRIQAESRGSWGVKAGFTLSPSTSERCLSLVLRINVKSEKRSVTTLKTLLLLKRGNDQVQIGLFAQAP